MRESNLQAIKVIFKNNKDGIFSVLVEDRYGMDFFFKRDMQIVLIKTCRKCKVKFSSKEDFNAERLAEFN